MKQNCYPFEIWPGPMEGVGKTEFVEAVNTLKLCDRWMTPFLRLSGAIPAERKLREFAADYLDSRLPVTIQLMGTDPDLLGKCAAKMLELTGAAGININMGCPSLRVVKNGGGGGLLKKPEQIAGFCRTVAGYLPPEMLSVKIRAGYDSPEDMQIYLPELASDGAVSKIFFHYRTVTENYSPAPLPEREQRIAAAVKLAGQVPVIANGDISSVEDAENVCKVTQCAGIMTARPWMRDPFLLRRFTDQTAPDAATGRELFFAELQKQGVSGGALIEMARMLWGVNSKNFLQLIANC
ncbi:MAG: tRNA-dihydrouridine synthase family protein [Lentisphaeria bacterium]|nr:tRNA-dihydrouridine synthase family protein [Lentisphaeria bacterium]